MTSPARSFSHVIRVRVRYAETDAMGVVYHGAYFPYLEEARVAMLDAAGWSYAQLERDGWRLPVREASIRYLKPARFDDRLDVAVTVVGTPGVRVHLAYEVRRGDDLLATAETHHAFVDRDGKPCRPPARFAAAFGG